MVDIRSFWDTMSESDKKAVDEKVKKASSTSQPPSLKHPGTYVMECSTFHYTDKNTGQFHTSPEIFISNSAKSKGAAVLAINLRVVDGTSLTPQGSGIFTNIPLLQPTTVDKKKQEDTIKLSKPRLIALLGHDNLELTNFKWIEENLIPSFSEDEKHEMLHDHKMKQKVLVVVEPDFYKEKLKLKVTSIVPAKETDKSVSIEMKEEVISDGLAGNAIDNDNIPIDNFGSIAAGVDMPAIVEDIPT